MWRGLVLMYKHCGFVLHSLFTHTRSTTYRLISKSGENNGYQNSVMKKWPSVIYFRCLPEPTYQWIKKTNRAMGAKFENRLDKTDVLFSPSVVGKTCCIVLHFCYFTVWFSLDVNILEPFVRRQLFFSGLKDFLMVQLVRFLFFVITFLTL